MKVILGSVLVGVILDACGGGSEPAMVSDNTAIEEKARPRDVSACYLRKTLEGVLMKLVGFILVSVMLSACGGGSDGSITAPVTDANSVDEKATTRTTVTLRQTTGHQESRLIHAISGNTNFGITATVEGTRRTLPLQWRSSNPAVADIAGDPTGQVSIQVIPKSPTLATAIITAVEPRSGARDSIGVTVHPIAGATFGTSDGSVLVWGSPANLKYTVALTGLIPLDYAASMVAQYTYSPVPIDVCRSPSATPKYAMRSGQLVTTWQAECFLARYTVGFPSFDANRTKLDGIRVSMNILPDGPLVEAFTQVLVTLPPLPQ